MITLAQRAGIGRFRSVGSGGTTVHHYVFGIGLLLTSGYFWLLLGGTQTDQHRLVARATTVGYGAAAALTIDEFNIWLHVVRDDYWKSPFRELIDASILTTSAVSIGTAGWPFFRALAREIRS